MEVFGVPIETAYLAVLITAGCLTVLYLLFNDLLGSIADAVNFIHPALILAFFTFFSAGGYILEKLTPLSHLLIITISIVIALILDTLLNVFVFVPLSTAEESLAYTEESLKGRVGKTILSIPKGGFGEVVIDSKTGTISKPAASVQDTQIEEGTQVLVIEVKNGVLYVVPYENYRLNHETFYQS
ncbi:NfeD family protein [Weizmannia acidilactici]|uniref:NfeD family protein n=1 Tax=Weizmannia acidilactici TaxID=2607726 RepID=UPI0012719EDE|nr:NfeD family protein [Weizmannia acidilactici]GER66732.1 putative membrane protein YuaF [Weizmannia acidilactici]GER73787.1 putative membrane protein YuaF [Weizmannia acidilactici]